MSAETSAAIKTAARTAGISASAWIEDVVSRQLRRDALREYLDDYQNENGAFTEEEREQTRQEFRAARKTGR